MRIKVIVFIAAVIVVSSCNDLPLNRFNYPSKVNALEKTAWLAGRWKNSGYGEVIFEEWKQESNTLMLGKSYLIKGRDTLLIETIRLVARGRDICYIPTVYGQNDGKPVTFKLTAAYKNELVFENPMHDFPQKILYKQLSLTSMMTEVSGIIDGQMQSETITMTRTNYFLN
jgi:hypothetical protein